MSLSEFCKYRPLRDAFVALHDGDCRKAFSTPSVIVPSVPGNDPSFVGMAFDHLARYSINSRAPENIVWRRDYMDHISQASLRKLPSSARRRSRWV